MKKILVTGAAGFVGFHLTRRLAAQGLEVVGVDNFNDYYDVQLKLDRLAELQRSTDVPVERLDLSDRDGLEGLLASFRPDRVVHLAAQAGVRHSLVDPHSYVDSNLVGFVNVLEACRKHAPEHLVYASSSSIYGANTKLPFSEHDRADHPLSLYGATKRANELLAHSYSHLFRLPVTGLRFFTVYGPWGRPDMAYYLFARAIVDGRPLRLFNEGRNRRVFTYVDDIVDAIIRVIARPATPDPNWSSEEPDPATSAAPYRIYNIGHDELVELERFVSLIERGLGRSAERVFVPAQAGDMVEMVPNMHDLRADFGLHPTTPLEVGLERFLAWFADYHGVDRRGGTTLAELDR